MEVAYDIVDLPSKGIFYENNKKSLRVAYLTAEDENILQSPNLLKNNMVVDELIKRKVLDKDFDVEELVEDDKQAILIFLRNTAFGSEVTVKLKDPATEKYFDYVLDLSVVKTNDLKLTPNSDGHYEFILPITKKKVYFQFLNKKQELALNKIKESSDESGVSDFVTKRMEMLIKRIDDERDEMAISRMIKTLPIKDSISFRNFVNENKPSLNLVYDAKAPSGEIVRFLFDMGPEFFRTFYGL